MDASGGDAVQLDLLPGVPQRAKGNDPDRNPESRSQIVRPLGQ